MKTLFPLAINNYKNNKHKPMNRYNELRSLIDSFEQDFKKFYDKGNHAAGTRVRQDMQAIISLAKEIRVEVQEIKKGSKNEWPSVGE